MSIINLDVYTFDLALNTADRPVLVDFWAEWCQPCKMMLPILEEISAEFSDKLVVAKVNIDTEPELAEGLSSVPTLRVYVGDRIVKEIVGAKPKRALLDELKEFIDASV